MSILVNKDSKVVVQGITGSEGQFHAGQMLDYGTNVVAGVTPGKGGQKTLDDRVLVFNSVEEAVEHSGADTSIIFVPPPFGISGRSSHYRSPDIWQGRPRPSRLHSRSNPVMVSTERFETFLWATSGT